MADTFAAASAPPISLFMAAALGRHAGLEGEDSKLFKNLVAELTAALLQGHICITLTEEQRRLVSRSRLVAEDRQALLVLSRERLYFGRYFGYESELSDALKKLAAPVESVRGSSAPGGDEDRHRAVAIALSRRFCIISGGPGTGKTTLIVAIVADLLAEHGSDLRIALAAPTGKAALRMQESIKTQLSETPLDAFLADRFPTRAMTLHRLLGLGRRAGRATGRHPEPLSYDVVVVDEASMVDLPMMWRLVRALKDDARLIMLGDRDQLASVESGAVLADCIDSLPENVVRLEQRYRFNETIARLADTVKSGAADEAWSLVSGSDSSVISIASPDWLDICIDRYKNFVDLAAKTHDRTDYPTVFENFNRFRLLCGLRRGLTGAEELNRRIERGLNQLGGKAGGTDWYPGKAVLIRRNDYNLGLYNGDIGICLPDSDAGGALRLWFEAADGSLKSYPPSQLPPHDPAWALTIHASQGSEFEEVAIVLPEIDSRVLCRELLYTAITRARIKVSLVAVEGIFKAAVEKKTIRYSGLAERLAR